MADVEVIEVDLVQNRPNLLRSDALQSPKLEVFHARERSMNETHQAAYAAKSKVRLRGGVLNITKTFQSQETKLSGLSSFHVSSRLLNLSARFIGLFLPLNTSDLKAQLGAIFILRK